MRSIGIIQQSIKMSLQNIKSNKMRSFLTMLGIVIGVAAVIGLVTIMQGATNAIMDQFNSLGAGTISVQVPGTALKRGLTEKDLRTIEELEGVDGVSPALSSQSAAVYKGEVFKTVSINGDSLAYYVRNANLIMRGRNFTAAEMDGNSNVMLVDKKFVEKVMGGDEPIGKTVRIGGMGYQIIGIMGQNDSMAGQMVDSSTYDGQVYVPYKNIMLMSNSNTINYIQVFTKEGVKSADVESELRSTLNAIFNNKKNSFYIFNMESLMSTMNTVTSLLSALLAGIASISLLVGGIGIMNMMLVSVTERTKEIGLRKALGAEPIRIQLQFLIESITLSVFGGIIGIALGLLIAFVGAHFMKTTFAISYSAIALGAGFSAGVGIIFGWMPARRASQLNPIDALRSD